MCLWGQVPGLNAPIPPQAVFGYQPGGWGKPPVNENGDPLYGDVFGQAEEDSDDDDMVCGLPVWILMTIHVVFDIQKGSIVCW